eukprot:4085436-Pyramimonas_sp.AAC.1
MCIRDRLRASFGSDGLLRSSSGNNASSIRASAESQNEGHEHSTDAQPGVSGKAAGKILFRGVDEELNARLLKRLRAQMSSGQDNLDLTGLLKKVGEATSNFRTAAMAFAVLGKAIMKEATHAGALLNKQPYQRFNQTSNHDDRSMCTLP